VSSPHAGRLEGGSDRLGSRRSGLKSSLLQPIAILQLAEVSLGRTDTRPDTLGPPPVSRCEEIAACMKARKMSPRFARVGAKSVLHRCGPGQHQHKPARADGPCAQLEFQSTAGDTAKVLAALTRHEPPNGKPPEASFKSQDTGSSYFSAILHSSFCLGCIHHSTFFILHSPQTCQTHRCEIRSCHEHTRVNRKGSRRDARAVTT
jgi:hypothetical protein